MRRTILLLTVCCLPCIAVACSSSAPPETANTAATTTTTSTATTTNAPAASPASTQIVRVTADALTLKPGAAGEAQVRLQIADGYHVNANPATFSYLKATEIELTPTEGVTAGKPTYPRPVTRQFHFAPQPLAVYEHEATIRLPLRVNGTAPKGAQSLRAQVSVQACDEEKCFPPTTIATDIPVTIN